MIANQNQLKILLNFQRRQYVRKMILFYCHLIFQSTKKQTHVILYCHLNALNYGTTRDVNIENLKKGKSVPVGKFQISII